MPLFPKNNPPKDDSKKPTITPPWADEDRDIKNRQGIASFTAANSFKITQGNMSQKQRKKAKGTIMTDAQWFGAYADRTAAEKEISFIGRDTAVQPKPVDSRVVSNSTAPPETTAENTPATSPPTSPESAEKSKSLNP